MAEKKKQNYNRVEDPNKYIVKKGENIYDIALKLKIDWHILYAKNKFIIGNNPDKIEAGQILKIN